MSASLTDQLRAYFDDVDRQQGVVDVDALQLRVEERGVTIELSPHGAASSMGPTSGRRWPILVAAAAVMLVVGGALVVSGDDGDDGPANPPPSTSVIDTTGAWVMQPLDPPVACELELCPSLAVSPEGILVAFDPAVKTITWYDAEPHMISFAADLDTDQLRLVAVTNWVYYLLAASSDTDSWELVAIGLDGEVLDRAPVSSPNVELSEDGLVERFCWSGCEPDVRLVMPWVDEDRPFGAYPNLSSGTGGVGVRLDAQRWEIAWPHALSTSSQAAPRWDGGATVSLVADSDNASGELVELLRDGTMQRFALRDEPVRALLADGSAVVWRDGQLVRLVSPMPAEPPLEWSPELTASSVEFPIRCVRSPWPSCEQPAVSPDGTLVTYDPATAALTWYDDDPHVVPITSELWGDVSSAELLAIGPQDVAYFKITDPYRVVAVGPTGAVIAQITRVDGAGEPDAQTAAGLIASPCTILKNRCVAGAEWPSPSAELVMPWVDLDGDEITDTRVYPTARDTDTGVEVRLGERTWLLTDEQLSGHQFPILVPRSDGGVVALIDETFHAPDSPIELVELLPDGTIERYVIPSALAVMPDGAVITLDRNVQLTRLTPPA